jgi:hypothetical protein
LCRASCKSEIEETFEASVPVTLDPVAVAPGTRKCLRRDKRDRPHLPDPTGDHLSPAPPTDLIKTLYEQEFECLADHGQHISEHW